MRREAYWGLKEKPFENTPDPRFLFHPGDNGDVFHRLLYALKGSRGAAMLTGESGCGKTLMARALVQELNPDNIEVAFLTNPSWGPDDFLREVLYQLGEDTQLTSRSDILHRVHEVLYENYEAGKETLVLIDESQLIEDPEVFEEIRLILNFQLNDAFLVTLLLVGQPQLADRVAGQSALDQRVAARGVVKPLQQQEVEQYIAHRLKTAGREEPAFADQAMDPIFEYSAGIPRKINNICDIALVVGFSRKLSLIDADWIARLVRAEGGNGP